MWPSPQPKPHPDFGHLLGNTSRIWPLLSAWSCSVSLLPTPNAAKRSSFQPAVWSTIAFPSAPFSWTPNPMQKKEPFPLTIRPSTLCCGTAFFPGWKIVTFPPPTAALLPLLQFSVYSCHPLCSLWAALRKANCEENPGRRKALKEQQSGLGACNQGKEGGEKSQFLLFL